MDTMRAQLTLSNMNGLRDRETERVKVRVKRKIMQKREAFYCGGGGGNIILSEDSQATPACPSDKDSVKVKVL
jgi:hypothetical protein